jgi:putative ABC transport system permease protein
MFYATHWVQHSLCHAVTNSTPMLLNYFKVAFRSLLRNKLTSFINICGLALAIACSLLIYLFLQDELSYDRYHSKADRVYRVTRSFHSPEGAENLHLSSVAPPIGPLLKNDFGEIEAVARTINYTLVVGLEKDGELKMSTTEQNLFLAEPSLFSIMDIPVVSGNAKEGLTRPFTVMLSEETAKRYFEKENPVGKRLRANNQFDLEVTGVFKDFPAQSHWHPDFLVSFSTLEDDNIYGRSALESNWGNNAFGTYILFQEGVDAKQVESKLPQFIDKHFGSYARQNWGTPADWIASKITTLYLQKLTDIHLHSHLDDELEANGNIRNVYMMGVIGLFIILIACFNFINLSTARATKRSKEVGLRKVVGAFRKQLISQYLTESVLIALFALLLAYVISSAGLVLLNSFTGKELTIALLLDPVFIIGILSFSIIIGVLAGVYPAFVISSFCPALTLKGQHGSAQGKSNVRRGLVVVQFAISIVLIIATIVTYQQLEYLNSRELGYSKDQVVTLPVYQEIGESYQAFYNELTKSSAIVNVGRSSRVPTGRLLDSYGNARIWKGDTLETASVDLKTIAVDREFFDTYSIPLVAGTNFRTDLITADSLGFIVNESAAAGMGWTDAKAHIGEAFEYAGVRGKLIGVVKDFHFESLHQPIVPMIFVNSNRFNSISVKVAANNTKEGLDHLEKVWKQFAPSRPFDYQFLSESYEALYNAEQKQSQLFTAFSGLAIFIASLGLFGLAMFNAMQRLKEIGIRKVLGASVSQLLGLLSKEIIILILVANLVAWPVAWYFMSDWLSSFAYHIELNVLVFAGGSLIAVAIAVLTVTTQTLKAATSNPAQTLKYE